MSNKECLILFDQNVYGTYFTGQTVSGRVIINFSKARKLKGIKLQICGFAACQWRQRHGKASSVTKGKKRKKDTYYGREDYVAATTYLTGAEQGSNFSMDAGTYTYKFACSIPFNCPSSFEGTYGHIRYLTKVTFMRAGASDRTYNVGFTVLKLLDLNQESRLLKTPASNEAMENICFLQTKAVYIKVDIVQTGYVPGQFILVSANVNNESGFDCKKLLIILNLRATYTSDTPCMRTTSEKMCMVKKVCGPVQRYSVKDFAETIRVPATPPTCEHLSKVVRVSYELCVIAVMNHFMRNPKTVIPITIGNMVLTDNIATVQSSAADDVPTTSAFATQAADNNAYDTSFDVDIEADEETEPVIDMPPPTYEEAMFMSTNIADDDVNIVSENAQFTPRFPVYDVEGLLTAHAIGLSPAPNKPQKRRRHRRRAQQRPEMESIDEIEKTPVESPIQI